MLKLKTYFICVLFIALNSNLSAQNRAKDSILNIIHSSNNDSIKISNFNKLIGTTINEGNLNKADSFLTLLNNLETKTHFKKKQYTCLYFKGYIYGLRGDYPNALNTYLSALKVAESLNNAGQIASLNSNIGVVYFTQNEYDKSLRYYFKAIKVIKDNNQVWGLGNFYTNIGNVYYKK